MKKKEAIELYKIMSPVKLTGMTSVSKMTVLENLRLLRPVSETHDADMKQALESNKPEGFDKLEEQVKAHNEAVRNDTSEGQLSLEELNRVNLSYMEYQKSVGECEEKLLAEVMEVDIKPIDKESFNKLVNANDIEAGKLELLMSYLLRPEVPKTEEPKA